MNIVQKHKQNLFLMGVLGLLLPHLSGQFSGLNEKYTNRVSRMTTSAFYIQLPNSKSKNINIVIKSAERKNTYYYYYYLLWEDILRPCRSIVLCWAKSSISSLGHLRKSIIILGQVDLITFTSRSCFPCDTKSQCCHTEVWAPMSWALTRKIFRAHCTLFLVC